uniref:Protein disulfide-isomerase n=1 Tax=Phallusia mammillata TaxID=59560 RepID=A0A6F9DNY6_9ASCI|nr:protein disulfide-isomerase A4-like [Phallusia mammillata]
MMKLLKSSLLLFLLGLVLTVQYSAADDEDDTETEGEIEETTGSSEPEMENGVYVLTDDNFDDFVEGKEVVLLEFYAPWCGHCKAFVPTYEKIAKELEGKVPVAKIDATASKTLGTRFEIQGYPTIKILRNGEPMTYEGGRTETEIISKVMELADPDWKPPPEAVLTLTADNFDQAVDVDIILVEFYAPWCGHCKKLAPEYEAAAQELKRHDPPIPLAKVDATAESSLGQKYDVSGYPTMKLFRHGRVYEYEGGRDKRGIVSYMLEQSKPPSTAVTSVKNAKNILHHASDVTIIGCFSGDDDKTLQLYQDAGNSLRSEYEFHHTYSEDVMALIGASVGEIVLFHPERFHSKFEEKSYKLKITDDVEKSDLEKFYNDHSVPLVGQRTRDNMKKRYSKQPLVVVYYTVDFSFDYRKATQVWRKKILEVANEMRQVTFAISNEDDFEADLKAVGLEDSGEEINVIGYDDKGRKYPMEPTGDFDGDVLREFVEEFLAGNIKPKYKSAPKPKKNSGPVKVVVGNTFDEIVLNKDKDVMIEFYAPWCGHCKKLEPIYKKLGKKLKDNNKVTIAKMDATANDIPHSAYKAEGFPTIYWSPAGDKDHPVKYEGGRELKDLESYIAEKMSEKPAKEEL